MSKHISIIILFLIGFCSNIFGQNSISTNFEITWITQNQKKVTPLVQDFFENQVISEKGMPEFILNLELKGRPDNCEVSLENVQVEIYNGSLKDEIINQDFTVSSFVNYGGSDAYAVSRINPFRLNSLGQIEKLISADALITSSGIRPHPVRSRASGNSVLGEGTWLKIKISADGIYRLDRAFFDENGFDSNTINPNAVNVYGNTGDQLPFDNSVFRYDDLEVNPIEFVGDEDAVFENGEYFIFYGDGPDSYEFMPGEGILNYVPHRHNYSDYAYYFIRIDDIFSSRIQNYQEPNGNSNFTVTQFDDFTLHENENVNVVKSGREWFGENFNLVTQLQLNFNFPNLVQEPSVMKVGVAGRSIGGESQFNFTTNQGESLEIEVDAISVDSPIASVVDIENGDLVYTPSGNTVTLNIDFDKYSSDSEAWLDYVALQCKRELLMSGNSMAFRSKDAISAGITDYLLGSVSSFSGFRIWDISNPVSPINITYAQSGNVATFKHEGTELSTFMAFRNSAFQTPEFVKQVENQNLHSLEEIDLVILSNVNFLAPAEELAEIHRNDGMTVSVVTPEQVFNEFSSGNPDVTAIKMLMKMLYDNAAGDTDLQPKHLCVFGDGTYRNREIDDNSPYVISYHSKNSWSPVNSYISDDYFAFLDDDESELTTDKMDIGIGRIVVRSEEEAFQMVDKVRRYLALNSTSDGGAACTGDGSDSAYGTWRNKLVFVSDDQDGNGAEGIIHMKHSQELIDTVTQFNSEFNFKKIFADAYVQSSTPGGCR